MFERRRFRAQAGSLHTSPDDSCHVPTNCVDLSGRLRMMLDGECGARRLEGKEIELHGNVVFLRTLD